MPKDESDRKRKSDVFIKNTFNCPELILNNSCPQKTVEQAEAVNSDEPTKEDYTELFSIILEDEKSESSRKRKKTKDEFESEDITVEEAAEVLEILSSDDEGKKPSAIDPKNFKSTQRNGSASFTDKVSQMLDDDIEHFEAETKVAKIFEQTKNKDFRHEILKKSLGEGMRDVDDKYEEESFQRMVEFEKKYKNI